MNITVIVVELLIMFLVFTFLVIGLLLINPVTFIQGLLLTYTYAIALFIWDTFFLDWVLFANVKRIRLPGTGHMDKEYHQMVSCKSLYINDSCICYCRCS